MLSMVVFLMMTGTVHAESMTTYTEGTLYYTIQNGSITITGCFGRDEEVQIPSSIAGYPVNVIGKDAFTTNSYVKKVVLPDTITQVEEGAFSTGTTVDYSSIMKDNNDQDNSKPNNPENGKDDSNTQKDPGAGNTDTSQKSDTVQAGNTGNSSQKTGNEDSDSDVFGVIHESEEQGNFEEVDVVLTEDIFATETIESTETDAIAETEKTEAVDEAIEADGKSNAPYIILTLSVLVIVAIGFVVWKRMKK